MARHSVPNPPGAGKTEWDEAVHVARAYPGSTGGSCGSRGRRKGFVIPSPLRRLLLPAPVTFFARFPFFSPFPVHASSAPPSSSSAREAILSVLSDMKACSVLRSLETHQRPSLGKAMTWRLIDHQMWLAQWNTNSTCRSQHGAERGARPLGPRADLTRARADCVLPGVSKHSGFPQCPVARQNILCLNVVSPERTSVPIDIQR